MAFDREYFDMGRLDRLSYGETMIHRLDPRSKVIVTIAFLVTVISYGRYEVRALAPFFAYPMLILTLSDTPFRFIAKKVLIVSPFAIFIGIFNPLVDSSVAHIGGYTVSAGWISFLSILMKFTLTISAALLLIATTSFPGICSALGRMGVPAPFTSQLMFLYRYLFVLLEEAMRLVRARDMRAHGGRGKGIGIYASMIGVLFARSLERAERVYGAMLARGFSGDMPTLRRGGPGAADGVFLAVSLGMFFVMRFWDIAGMVGHMAGAR